MKSLIIAFFLMASMSHLLAQTNIQNLMPCVPLENVIIQTNQQIYNNGDRLWIRCHLIDGITHIPSTSPTYTNQKSNFVYVELYDCLSNKLINRYKLKADSLGVFSNAIDIPNNINEGYYMLVAYTRWMMNFKESNFGYKEIYIVGNKEVNKQTNNNNNKLSIQVYYEGGCLLPQHIQTITYTVNDNLYHPQNAEVRLINTDNDSIIANSHTEFSGMGQISFSPLEAKHYHLEAYTPNGAFGKQDIHVTETPGAVLQIKRRNSLISIDVITHNYDTNKLRLLAYNHGSFMPIDTSGNKTMLSTESFHPGKVVFILIDYASNRILSTRTIYISDPSESQEEASH